MRTTDREYVHTTVSLNKKLIERDNEMVQLTKMILKQTARHTAEERETTRDSECHCCLILCVRGRLFNSCGVGWAIFGIKNFFSSNLVGRIFFSLFFPQAFYYICAACNFFLPTSACRKFFFKITHPPPQELNGRPLNQIKTRNEIGNQIRKCARRLLMSFRRLFSLTILP